MNQLYDEIGRSYRSTRAADDRIRDSLTDLLQLAPGSKLLDIGAGTGNYSAALAERGYRVTALEPSRIMRNQGKQHSNLTWIDGVSEDLPFSEASFEAVVMTLSMHHFSDWKKALREALRVVGGGPLVTFTFDPEFESGFWLYDYFPTFREKDLSSFPPLDELREFSSDVLDADFEVRRFALPRDLVDNFAAAGWARPEFYLDSAYREGISSFATMNQNALHDGLEALRDDLRSGALDAKLANLKNQSSLDVGYIFLKLRRRRN